MQTTIVQRSDAPARQASEPAGWYDFFIGLALTALVPAAFWMAAFACAAGLIGYTPDLGELLIAGSAIAAFLGVFFAVLAAKPL